MTVKERKKPAKEKDEKTGKEIVKAEKKVLAKTDDRRELVKAETGAAKVEAMSYTTLKYPIFCCNSNLKDMVAVGGGGGTSKTGVPNAINLFQWCNDGSSNFTVLETLPTSDCISNLAFQYKRAAFAYAIDSKLHLVEYGKGAFKELKTVNVGVGSPETSDSKERYEIQKIRFTRDSEKLLTVDTDRVIKVFGASGENKLVNTIVTGHTDEINDIDIHPTSTYIVTTSKDKTCKVINFLSGKVEHTLHYKHKQIPLGFRGCKFSPDNAYLYTCQSTPRTKTFQGCAVISKWEFLEGTVKEIKSHEFHTAHNTTFDLSPDGKYIAVGTADSMITVIETDQLKTVDRWEPHGFIITDLSFSPDSTSVFSVSADYSCRSHKIGETPFKNTSKNIVTILIILISLIILIISYQLVK